MTQEQLDEIRSEYDQMTDEQILEEMDRLSELDETDETRESEIERQIWRRSGACNGDVTTDYFYCCVHIKQLTKANEALEAALRGLLSLATALSEFLETHGAGMPEQFQQRVDLARKALGEEAKVQEPNP